MNVKIIFLNVMNVVQRVVISIYLLSAKGFSAEQRLSKDIIHHPQDNKALSN